MFDFMLPKTRYCVELMIKNLHKQYCSTHFVLPFGANVSNIQNKPVTCVLVLKPISSLELAVNIGAPVGSKIKGRNRK